MPVILDPNRSFVSFVTYYNEGSHGITVVDTPGPTSFCLQTSWKRLNWKEQNSVLSQCMVPVKADSTIYLELNSIKYRELKLRACLKKWDAKDEDNKEIPLNDETIANLDPNVATALLRQFESATEPSERDLEDLEDSARRFYEGKKPVIGLVSQYIYEHLLAKYYGWSLKDIRAMDYYDFMVHLRLCMLSDIKDKEFELSSRGLKKDKLSADEILRKKAEDFL